MPVIPFPFTALPVPRGLIELWAGTTPAIPQGWQLCDGTNGSPDLRDKFVRGINTAIDQPGSIGGQDTVTLSASTLPVHDHETVSYSHSHRYSGTTNNGDTSTALFTLQGLKRTSNGNESDDTTNSQRNPPSGFTRTTGSNASHNNIPPFFTLAYIFKR